LEQTERTAEENSADTPPSSGLPDEAPDPSLENREELSSDPNKSAPEANTVDVPEETVPYIFETEGSV
jgi:hypothetical protein